LGGKKSTIKWYRKGLYFIGCLKIINKANISGSVSSNQKKPTLRKNRMFKGHCFPILRFGSLNYCCPFYYPKHDKMIKPIPGKGYRKYIAGRRRQVLNFPLQDLVEIDVFFCY
jgi:hypothetical protein